MLKVTTTHLKEGWVRRNGLPRSDRATIVEYFDSQRGLPDARHRRDGSGLPDRAVRAHVRLGARPGAAAEPVLVHPGDRDRAAARRGAAPPAGHERVPDRVSRAAWVAVEPPRAAARRRCIRTTCRSCGAPSRPRGEAHGRGDSRECSLCGAGCGERGRRRARKTELEVLHGAGQRLHDRRPRRQHDRADRATRPSSSSTRKTAAVSDAAARRDREAELRSRSGTSS